jgi:hypothetical protein
MVVANINNCISMQQIKVKGVVMEWRWRAPKSLVSPKLGLSHSSCRNVRDSKHIPSFQHYKGKEGRAKSSGIRLGRGTSYLVTRSCIQNQPTSGLVHIWNTMGVGTSHRQPWTHLTHHGLDSGKPPPSPIQYSLWLITALASEWHFFLGLPKWSPGLDS